MTAEMKWYIFNEDHSPLCWTIADKTSPALQFDTEFDAVIFLNSVCEAITSGFEDAYVKACIFFYDDGKLNASGWEIAVDQLTGETELVTWRQDANPDVLIKCREEE